MDTWPATNYDQVSFKWSPTITLLSGVEVIELTPGCSKSVGPEGSNVKEQYRCEEIGRASLLGPLNQVTPCWRPPVCDGPSLLHHHCKWAAALLLTADALNEPAVPWGFSCSVKRLLLICPQMQGLCRQTASELLSIRLCNESNFNILIFETQGRR